jgi:hypothetical protein
MIAKFWPATIVGSKSTCSKVQTQSNSNVTRALPDEAVFKFLQCISIDAVKMHFFTHKHGGAMHCQEDNSSRLPSTDAHPLNQPSMPTDVMEGF